MNVEQLKLFLDAINGMTDTAFNAYVMFIIKDFLGDLLAFGVVAFGLRSAYKIFMGMLCSSAVGEKIGGLDPSIPAQRREILRWVDSKKEENQCQS